MSASSNVHNSSTSHSGPSLRPRARRLISGLSEGEPETSTSSSLSTSLLQPQLGRSSSPAAYSSRSRSPQPTRYLAPPASDFESRNAPRSTSFWNSSWSTLQGLASDLIGSDITSTDGAGGSHRSRRPRHKLHNVRSTTTAPPDHWGPAEPSSLLSTSDIGKGTREEQLAAFRTERRRAMLTHQESSYADTLGKFKRRLSDERPSASAPPADNEERDALVYVHEVQKNDTLAGITIKYNCSAAALRKANRMWPNDTVQMREVILLPVDACGVKGKLVSGPGEVDLLGTESEALSAGHAEEINNSNETPSNGLDTGEPNRSRAVSTSTRTSSVHTEVAWQPDSWVLLPGSTKPIQIGRLPRRAVGYFPPARRKSISFSDTDSNSHSLELTRSNRIYDDIMKSGLLGSGHEGSRATSRSRASKNGIPAYLTGPGGVGTLGRNVRIPGPAEDGLNRYFAKHLPDVAPPRNHHALLAPEMPMYTDDVTPPGSGRATPTRSKNINLSNVGGHIEAWARRMASKTQGAMSPGRQRIARASVGTPSAGVDGMGDLIEMTNDFDLGSADDEEEDELGRIGRRSEGLSQPGRAANKSSMLDTSSTATSYFEGGVRGRHTLQHFDGGDGKGKSGKAD